MSAMITTQNEITVESLLRAIIELPKRLDNVEQRLRVLYDLKNPEPDRWLGLQELCDYHPDKPTKPTVYGWIAASKIPNHRDGKRLRFLKSEIDEWLKTGRRKTAAETAIEAQAYLSSKK